MSPNPSQSSFIPKRGASRAKSKKPARRIFIFSIVAYSLIFASLLASGASYLYLNYTKSLLQEKLSALNSEINTFSVSDLSVVSEFDLTLKRANQRFDNTASVASLLDAIDSATAEPVQVESLSLERVGDQDMLLTAQVITQSFDGALFQRGLLNDENRLFRQVVFEGVAVSKTRQDESSPATVTQGEDLVTLTANAQVPIESLSNQNFQAEALNVLEENTDNQTAL